MGKIEKIITVIPKLNSILLTWLSLFWFNAVFLNAEHYEDRKFQVQIN